LRWTLHEIYYGAILMFLIWLLMEEICEFFKLLNFLNDSILEVD